MGISVMVNVLTKILINRPLKEVAGYVSNPDNAPKWYVNIAAADWVTNAPLTLGTKITFTANFLGTNYSPQ